MASAGGGILGDLVFSDSSQQPGRHLCPTASTIRGQGSSYGAFLDLGPGAQATRTGEPFPQRENSLPLSYNLPRDQPCPRLPARAGDLTGSSDLMVSSTRSTRNGSDPVTLASFSGEHAMKLYFFIWLHQVLAVACRIFSCSVRTQLWHVGSCSPTRGRTQRPCIGS